MPQRINALLAILVASLSLSSTPAYAQESVVPPISASQAPSTGVSSDARSTEHPFPDLTIPANADAKTLDEIVTRLVVHGVLHVLGHDHARASEARVMRAEERRLWRLLRS